MRMEIVTKGPSLEEWTDIRPLFTWLYLQEGRTLKDVRALLASEHGFKATVRMFKTQIGLWGLDKKRKEDEMRAFVAMAFVASICREAVAIPH